MEWYLQAKEGESEREKRRYVGSETEGACKNKVCRRGSIQEQGIETGRGERTCRNRVQRQRNHVRTRFAEGRSIQEQGIETEGGERTCRNRVRRQREHVGTR
jgi:hypothetical protein